MDLAEAVDDLICIFDGSGDTTMDTLAMFIFGWLLAALFTLWLGKLIYNRFLARAIDKTLDVTASAPVTPTTGASKTDAGAAATTDKVDASAKRSASTASASATRSGGRAVGSTPTAVRRRLTRQSPAPEPRKHKFVPAPTTSGSDNISVLWVNDVFQWLYNDASIITDLTIMWLQSLNEVAKKAFVEEGIGIEFVRVLPETKPPIITNVFSECASNDDVTITCDCEATPAFQVKCTRMKGEKTEVSHYRANVNRLRARLNIFSVSEKLQTYIKCDGWPEIKIAFAAVGNIKNNLDDQQLQEVMSDIAINSLRNMEVHFNMANYPSCPRLVRHVDNPGGRIHYDSQSNAYTSTPNTSAAMDLEGNKRLLVKVVKASQLGATQGCKEPFCVVELDEPPQRQQTGVMKGTDSPSWEEHFLFDLTPHTAEILFEVYDHGSSPHRFLGLGIVGVEELLINPSQRQIISLQSRPYESDVISGTLTVEFMFIEGPEIPPTLLGQSMRVKESIRGAPGTAPTIMTRTTTTFRNDNLMNGDHLAKVAINDIERNRDAMSNVNKSSLVIHSVARQPSTRLVKVELSDGTWKEIERVEKPLDGDEATAASPETEEVKENGLTNGNHSAENGDKPADQLPTNNTQPTPEPAPEFRGRTRKRRDFFGTIKRRLGKSKNRSKSAGPDDENGRDDSLNRSISADRSRGEESYRLGIPGRNELETSRRSSISEASGLSTASNRTYINEASTLVLETIENGIKKHYLVPLSLAQKSKWRKKGSKLHIFNDHTFIAKHLQGGTVCQVCCKSIARRIGKQGYECRDCLLKCHKHCHVKVNDTCPTSTIYNIELLYIQNLYPDKNMSML